MPKSLQSRLLAAVVIVASYGQSCLTQAQGADDTAAAQAAIRQTGKEYLAAIEKGDAKAIAAFWTPDGTYTDETGVTFKAHELIEKSFIAKQEAHPPTEITAGNVRLVTPDVGIEEGSCKISTGSDTRAACCFSAVWVRKDGKWKLASLRESRADSTEVPADQLAALEPFVGQWSGQAGKISMQVTAKWNSNKTFLRRDLNATSDGQEIFHGHQIIGWDPISKELRTWTFNDDGGFAEGLLSLEGNVWIAAISGVKPNGETATTTQVFKFLNKDKMLWKLKTGGGEQPLTTEFQIELTRAAK